MRKSLMAVMICIGLATPTWAEEKSKLAERLLDLMHVQSLIKVQQEQMRTMIMPQIREMLKGVTGAPDAVMEKSKAVEDRLFKVIERELSWAKMKDDYIALYTQTFSEKELKGAVAFYDTEAGQAFVAKQPELVKRSMALGQSKVAIVMPEIQRIMREEMEKATKPPAQPEPHAPKGT